MDDLACQELVELVTGYLEGVLGPVELARVNEHLTQCEGCENYLAQVRTTIRLTAATAVPDAEPAVDTRLLALHRQWLQDRARR